MTDMLAFLGVSSLVKHLMYHLWSDRLPRDAVLVGHVRKLNVFPVKSMRETDVPQMSVSSDRGTGAGDVMDRQWVVVTSEQKLVSIRQEPRLLSVQPRFDGKTLILTSSGYDDITVNVNEVIRRGEIVQADLSFCAFGLDCGDAVGKWLDHFLNGSGHRLLYSGDQLPKRTYVHDLNLYISFLEKRPTKIDKSCYRWRETDPVHKTLFQDIAPVHLLSQQSVDDLNSRLEQPMDALQFRPNIVVDATAGAYDEDTWTEIFIGNTRYKTTRLMDRCVLPTIDRTTCKRNQNNEPLKTLKRYRSILPGLGPVFGTDLVVERPGTIHVGDPIFAVRGSITDG